MLTMGLCAFCDHGVEYALSNNVVALVARGVATTFGSVYPSPTKDTDETLAALKTFNGGSPARRIYSGNADELMSAARFLSIPHEAPRQGMPQANGIIGRAVQDMVSGGLERRWWQRGCRATFGHMLRHATGMWATLRRATAAVPLHSSSVTGRSSLGCVFLWGQ